MSFCYYHLVRCFALRKTCHRDS